MAANLDRRRTLPAPSIARLYRSLDQMAEGLEVLEAELIVSALRNQTSISAWTHDKLAAIAAALDDLRDALDASPRTPD